MDERKGAAHDETILSSVNLVSRRGNVVLRPSGPWTPSVHALLRHIERKGFPAPRVIGTGFDSDGREMLSYVEGELVHPYAWSDEALVVVAQMLRRLHVCTGSLNLAGDAVWKPWFLRSLGSGERVLGHGDVAPWNMLTRDGMPIALVDWEYSGPVDPITELARVCWLFPQLVGDEVAERWGLPPVTVRAQQVRLIADSYGISSDVRRILLDRIIEVVVHEAANEANELQVSPESMGPLWGLTWKIRSAAWILQHRSVLEQALA